MTDRNKEQILGLKKILLLTAELKIRQHCVYFDKCVQFTFSTKEETYHKNDTCQIEHRAEQGFV